MQYSQARSVEALVWLNSRLRSFSFSAPHTSVLSVGEGLPAATSPLFLAFTQTVGVGGWVFVRFLGKDDRHSFPMFSSFPTLSVSRRTAFLSGLTDFPEFFHPLM